MTIIIITLFLIDFWINESNEFKTLRRIKDKVDFKPFNCGYCLSFEIGLSLSIVLLNPLYMSLPLLYKILTK
jgi:hypothetical protein